MAVLFLLVGQVVVFNGTPGGALGARAADVRGCADPCPCEGRADADAAWRLASPEAPEADAVGPRESGSPADDDDCGDNCESCGCCMHMAAIALRSESRFHAAISEDPVVHARALAGGVRSGIFRPPCGGV